MLKNKAQIARTREHQKVKELPVGFALVMCVRVHKLLPPPPLPTKILDPLLFTAQPEEGVIHDNYGFMLQTIPKEAI